MTIILTSTIVSILISGPLSQILNSIKQLQITVHAFLIAVSFPATSTIFFGMLMQILTFQFYDFNDFYTLINRLDSGNAAGGGGVNGFPKISWLSTTGRDLIYAKLDCTYIDSS